MPFGFTFLCRPTPVSSMIGAFGFQEHLLYCKDRLLWWFIVAGVSPCVILLWRVLLLPAVLEELVNTGRLKGTVVGGRQDKAVYIPDIYSKTQNAWVDSFLQQNGYLGMILVSATSHFLFFRVEPPLLTLSYKMSQNKTLWNDCLWLCPFLIK